MDQSVLGMIGMATSLVSIICWVLTLVKMFQNDTVLKGILGILCPLWALIWGWMEADRVNHKNVMIVWSIAIAAGIVLNVMTVMNDPALQGGGGAVLPPAFLNPGL